MPDLQDPFDRFDDWLKQALSAHDVQPDAMTLATVDSRGHPSARVVLLRGHGPDGFRFFTNFESRKGRELVENPHAALVFWWGSLQRQVRIEGRVERLPDADSDAYFARRPRGSRLSAVISPQSAVIDGREVLEQRVSELAERLAGGEVPRPPYWGGYRVVPEAIEFWQGREDRLHDRELYRLVDGTWLIERLAP